MKLLLNLIILLSFSILLNHLPSCTSSSQFPTEALPTKSGYLRVNSTSNSFIFYTFYEAKNPISSLLKTPLLIWLQGGPGCSSMTGNFFELGPWRVNRSLQLEPNPGSWNRLFGLLFLDNPIGTGFSIAATLEEIPKNQHGVAQHLFTAIKAFIELDKKGFQYRTIYITGESYAGKYVPAIGYYIVQKNAKLRKQERVNFGGIAIGNGLTDPVTQVQTHGLNAYYCGLINENQKSQLEIAQNEAVKLARERKWSEATDARNRAMLMLQNMTGLATLYDMTRTIPYESKVVEFLSNKENKKALGVMNESSEFEECSKIVGHVLHEDVMKSVKYMVGFLLKESKVLLYQGQRDLKDGVVSVEAYIKTLKWEGIGMFLNAERKVWKVNGELAGYVQKWGSLSHVVVLNAGHFVPTDQPLHSQAMIEDWVLKRGLFADNMKIDVKSSHRAPGYGG